MNKLKLALAYLAQVVFWIAILGVASLWAIMAWVKFTADPTGSLVAIGVFALMAIFIIGVVYAADWSHNYLDENKRRRSR